MREGACALGHKIEDTMPDTGSTSYGTIGTNDKETDMHKEFWEPR
jgi:hypothetical protein